jgi:predicted RNase H-like nuclease (RuvC/YqgF family)
MPIVTEIYSREDIENKDKKIQELERDVGNLKFQVSEYQQIVEELSEKLANYSRIRSQNNE